MEVDRAEDGLVSAGVFEDQGRETGRETGLEVCLEEM